MELDYTKIILLEVVGVAVCMTCFVLYRYYKLSSHLKKLNSGEGNDKQLLTQLEKHLSKLDHYAELPEEKEVSSFLTEDITKVHIYTVRRNVILIELRALEQAENYPDYERLAGEGYANLMQELQNECKKLLATKQKSYEDIIDERLKEVENQEYRFGTIPLSAIAIGHMTNQSAYTLLKAILKLERESFRKSDNTSEQFNELITGLNRLFSYITERYIKHTGKIEGTLSEEYNKIVVEQHKREITFYKKRVDYLERLKDSYKAYIHQMQVGVDQEQSHKIILNMTSLIDEAQEQIKLLEEEIYKDHNFITILKNKVVALEITSFNSMRDAVKDDVAIRRMVEKNKQETEQLLSMVNQLELENKNLLIDLSKKDEKIKRLSDKTDEEKIRQSYNSVLNRLKKISHDYRHLEKQYLDLKSQQSHVG